MKLKILLITILLLVPSFVFASRTDNYWDNIGTYIKTNLPTGYNVLINGVNKYLNFNTISGSAGYGIRDNGGTIEIKNSGGAWNDVVSASNSVGSAYQVLNTNESGVAEWTYDLGSATQRLGTIYSDYLRTKWLEVSQNVIDNSFKIGSSTNALSTNLLFSNSFGDSSLVYDTGGAFKFSTASNTNALTILNNGNVGLGTATPPHLLTLHSDTANTVLGIYNSHNIATNRNWAIINSHHSYGDLAFKQSNAQNGDPRTAGTTRLYISKDGYVGVGTSNPSFPLQVNSSFEYALRLSNQPGTWYYDLGRDQVSGAFKIQGNQSGANDIALAPTGGRVGIGTASPLYSLQVNTTSGLLVKGTEGVFIRGNGYGEIIGHDGTAYNDLDIRATANAGSGLYLTTGGRVGVGTAIPNEKLAVNGGIAINGDGVYASYSNNTYSDTSWHGARIAFNRSRGTESAPSAVIANDTIGWFDYFGRDGSSLQRVGRFALFVDGTVSNGVVPGRFAFSTVGASGVLSDRLTLFANDNVSMANNGGNVGIGTTNPTAKLHSVGATADNTFIFERAGQLEFNLRTLNSGGAQVKLKLGAPEENWTIQNSFINSTDRRLDFISDSNTVLSLLQSGNIGIGNTNPGQKLDVNGIMKATAVVANGFSTHPTGIGPYVETYIYNGDTGRIFAFDGASYYDLAMGDWNGGNPNIMLKAGGNVGINRGNPTYKLDVAGNLRTDNGANFATVSGNVGIGTTAPNQQLEITKNFRLPSTTSDTNGVIYKDGNRFIHDFNYGNNGTVTTVGGNVFIGTGAGNFTSGSTASQNYHSSYNSVVGFNSLQANTIGFSNTAIGGYSLHLNTTGAENVAIGLSSMHNLITGAGNTAIGTASGRWIADGTTANTNGSNSVFIGRYSKALADSQTNQIVIGYNAIGKGSNTIKLGNDSILRTYTDGEIIKGKEQSVVPGVAFTQTTNKTIANTITETSLIGTGVGSTTIPANTLQIGRTYRVKLKGFLSGANGTNSTVKIKLGSVELVSSLGSLPANITNAYYEAEFEFTVRSIGASGTIIGQGRTVIVAGVGIITSYTRPLQMTSTATINTTQDNALDATYTWGTAGTGNTITNTNASIEVLN